MTWVLLAALVFSLATGAAAWYYRSLALRSGQLVRDAGAAAEEELSSRLEAEARRNEALQARWADAQEEASVVEDPDVALSRWGRALRRLRLPPGPD